MDYKSIEEKANELTKIYSEPRIPVSEIIRKMGLETHRVSFGEHADDFSGFCDFENKDIYLNRDDISTRQYFTAAHELGHWILHKEKYDRNPDEYSYMLSEKRFAEDGNGHDLDEKEADHFATYLIMPRSLLEKFRHHSRYELAEAFGVTRAMLEKRLRRL